MAHLIDLTNHRANMAYTGPVPWHGLGQKLSPDSPLEVWAHEAGMAYTLNTSNVVFRYAEKTADDTGVGVYPSQKVIWRSDTKQPLSTCSDKYKIVQPGEVLEFFRDLVDAAGDYSLETAGVLDEGRKYWALARHKNPIQFGSDRIQPYLMLASSCDGTMSTVGQHTSVRVVCNNTLQMSLREDSAGQSIKISHRSVLNSDRLKERLKVGEAHSEFKDDIDFLINKAIARPQAAELIVDLLAKRDSNNEITNEKSVKSVAAKILRALDRSPGANLETARGTSWGVMNAVTNYVDFSARAQSNNNRFKSSQFGEGAKLKQQAFELLKSA